MVLHLQHSESHPLLALASLRNGLCGFVVLQAGVANALIQHEWRPKSLEWLTLGRSRRVPRLGWDVTLSSLCGSACLLNFEILLRYLLAEFSLFQLCEYQSKIHLCIFTPLCVVYKSIGWRKKVYSNSRRESWRHDSARIIYKLDLQLKEELKETDTRNTKLYKVNK